MKINQQISTWKTNPFAVKRRLTFTVSFNNTRTLSLISFFTAAIIKADVSGNKDVLTRSRVFFCF